MRCHSSVFGLWPSAWWTIRYSSTSLATVRRRRERAEVALVGRVASRCGGRWVLWTFGRAYVSVPLLLRGSARDERQG